MLANRVSSMSWPRRCSVNLYVVATCVISAQRYALTNWTNLKTACGSHTKPTFHAVHCHPVRLTSLCLMRIHQICIRLAAPFCALDRHAADVDFRPLGIQWFNGASYDYSAPIESFQVALTALSIPAHDSAILTLDATGGRRECGHDYLWWAFV